MLIPKSNFYLKNPNATESTLISLYIKFNKQRVVVSTGEKIHPLKWDVVKQRVISSRNNVESNDINLWLDKIDNTAKTIFRDFHFSGETPNSDQVKKILEEKLHISKEIAKPDEIKTLFPFIEKFIAEQKTLKSERTVKSYKTTLAHLKEFATSIFKTDFQFDDITIVFYKQYLNFLYTKYNLAINSVGKDIKILKLLLNHAYECGIHKNLAFKSRLFKKPVIQVQNVYLTEEEIFRIYQLELGRGTGLETVRDLFVIGCYTGLRFSDFSLLLPEHIGPDFIEKITQKTKQKVIIPKSNLVNEILEKYNNKLPSSISNQKTNDHLKAICKMAQLNSNVEVFETSNGQTKKRTYPKWELISSHTARRSFATNAYLSGVPAISIMKITGHKNDKSFLSYICIDQLQNAEHIKSHEFFNKSRLRVA